MTDYKFELPDPASPFVVLTVPDHTKQDAENHPGVEHGLALSTARRLYQQLGELLLLVDTKAMEPQVQEVANG